MGGFSNSDISIEGDVYIQRLSAYIRKHEEALANGLLSFSKNHSSGVKPLRISFTIHHFYFLAERIDSSQLGVDVGPLNIKLDNPNHEPTFISFMANNARSSKHFESDAKSITSINSMKSIVSSASVYWRNFSLSKDPKVVTKDLRYLYSSFTKIPCLILTPKTKVNSINGYEEYPCDTSVPVKMFKNLQVLEIVDYEPNEIFGWNQLSEQLRILIIRNSKLNDIAEVLFTLVVDDENGRSSFNSHKQTKKDWLHEHSHSFNYDYSSDGGNSAFKYKRERATTTGAANAVPRDFLHEMKFALANAVPLHEKSLPDSKWCCLKQLTVSETSITSIPAYIFKPLSNLVKLNLSGNLLDALPHGLDQLVNIKYLNFADNYITNLKNLPRNLTHLLTLNLSNNKLVEIDGIENLACLEKLDLRRNQLKTTKLLKPLILQFIKSPDKFNNIYLSGNGLPKGYRADMFNLFNGVKYKNRMKIDDSRPGYFEGALLFDAEGAFRFLEKFFDIERRRSSVSVRDEDEINKVAAVLTVSQFKLQIQSMNKGHRATKSTSDITEIMDPMSSLNLGFSKPLSPTATLTSDANSITSTSSNHKTSPLRANLNLGNQDPIASKRQSVIIPSVKPSKLKHSSTLTQIDIEMNHPAPVMTPVQVQVEGFQ